MRITFSKTLLLATTAFSMISVPAANAYLSPLSFNEMYAHASRGNLTVLNNAILRGMNINAVNGDGDTGICVAIRRGDHIAYESFRNTGAHTRPRCLNNINAKQYKKFMADHRPYELAYRKEGSSIWWWIGGAAAVGGIALAAGGGGGGGGSDPLPVPAPEDPTFHSNKGLGYVVATSDPSEPETTPYEPVMISAEDKTTEVNRESIQLSNNAKMWVYNPDTFGYDTLLLSDLIDFDKDINSYTKYIRVGMRAYNDSVVINDTEQTISAGSGTVGLDALLNSSASNLGTIEISAPNGSIGMVASDYSEAGNTGTISMEFTGKDTADSLIGMYADTNSSLTNAGTISGKADTARGRVTGMQTRLTSYYADFVNKAVNSGKIELSGSSDNAGGMSLWGMSSWLDRAFIDGDKSAAKLDKATLTNKGDISLTFSLQPSDEEGAVDPEDPLTLAAGNGGIVGMHADANTTATNNGNITIAVTGDAGETLSAGMQAVRGGSIVNGSGKNITVSAEGSAYGMMAISGSNGGKNFTDVKSAVDNRGSITVTAGDTAYGIYSSVKGDVKNSGKITINGAGYGIFNQNGSVNSSGSIIVAGTGEKGSYGIYAEAEAGSGNKITNAADITMTFAPEEEGGDDEEEQPTLPANYGIYGWNVDIENSGSVSITQQNEKSEDVFGIVSEESSINNSGTVVINGNGSAIKAADGSITNNASATVYGNGSVLNGQNGNVTNNEKGQLNIYTDGKASAYGIYLAGSTGNTITNKASIFINRYGAYAQAASTGNYGIWTDNAKIVNSGDISLGSSTAGLSGIYGLYAAGSGSIENSGVINLYGAGTAIYTASGTVNNTATSGIINIYTDGSADSFGIAAGSGNNGLISNSNKISITAQNGNASAKKNTGIAANNIKNSGTVQIGSSIQAIDKAIGLDGKSIDNDGEILLYGNNAAGIFSDDENADVTNNGRIELNGNGGIGISVTGGNGTVTNTGAITVTSSGRAYGIKNEAGSVENDAVITLNASSSYGILAKNIENSGEIYINKSSGYGLTATDGGSITNYGSITASGSANDGLYGQGSSSFHNEGNITIDGQGSWGLRSSNNVETYNSGRINMSGNKSYGMKIEKGTVENHGDITTADAESFGIWVNNVDSLTNSGTVTVNGADSVGIYAGGSSGATNSGTINVNGDGGKGINTTANSSFTNKGTINVNGKNGYGIYAEGTSKVTNSGDIYLNATTATKTSSALYAGGSAVIENSGNLHITASGNGYIWAAYAEGSGSIKNSGTIYVDKATDLIFSGNVTNNGTIEAAAGRMLLNEQVKFGSNARFVADEIAGTASVSADTVKQSNRTQFVLSGNFEGNTDRLNVRSESYLFDADFDGEKTTLSMKKFAEVENNASIAGFLQNNYGRNNSDLFDELKSASSQKELTKRISQISGRDVIPTMAEQNLALMKDLHRQFDNAWFNAAPDDKLIAGFNYYDRERGGYGNFAGSDDNAVSLFGIFRNNEGKNVSYGLGWSISKFDSKYDNGGKKDEVIAEILLPFGFGNENFRFLGNMYGGYGNGEYKRYAEGGRFTGDVENYYYGVNNELRGSFDAGFGISLQPTAEFNVAGLYQSGIDDGGLKTGHNNNLSVESGFGLYAEKEFLFNDENSLRLRFGGTWYHEFNDKYQTVKARLDGMEGCFAMDRAEYEKDRGLFSLNGEYRNGGFSFYGETAFEAGRSDNWIFNTGFKYAF